MWSWFHRVLLGTLLELFRTHQIAADASTLDLTFDDGSIFQFPALDNKLRFVGSASADLLREVPADVQRALQADLEKAWPDLVREIKRFPVPDRLAVTRNEIRLLIEGTRFRLEFDLEAD
tara:strand:+ start:276 stop:635 length:360 start_codon:yes stop_codon:yes gene_type:complete